jgi:hypothetical protein
MTEISKNKPWYWVEIKAGETIALVEDGRDLLLAIGEAAYIHIDEQLKRRILLLPLLAQALEEFEAVISIRLDPLNRAEALRKAPDYLKSHMLRARDLLQDYNKPVASKKNL